MNVIEEKLTKHLHTRAAQSEVRFTIDDVLLGRPGMIAVEETHARQSRLPRLLVGAVLVVAVGVLATVALSSGGRPQLDSVPANPDVTTPTSAPTTTSQPSAQSRTEPNTATTSGELPIETANVGADISLVERVGVPVLEAVVREVPGGTVMIEIIVNDRLQARSTYIPGSILGMRVAFNTELDVVVIAVSASNVELGRSDVQRLGRVDSSPDPSPTSTTPSAEGEVDQGRFGASVVETTFSGVVAGIEGLTVERVEYDSSVGRCEDIVLTLDSGESGSVGGCGGEDSEPGRSLSEAARSSGGVVLADRRFAIFGGTLAPDTFASGTRLELDVYGLTTTVIRIGPDGWFFTVVELDAPIDRETVLANPLVWRAISPDGSVLDSYTIGRSPASDR